MGDKDKEAYEKYLVENNVNQRQIWNELSLDEIWQAACDYKQKEIDELKDKIHDLQDDIKDFCSLIDYVFHFVEEGKDFFWLGDNIHSVYSSEQGLIKKAKETLKEIRE